jgi:hypothetical protein
MKYGVITKVPPLKDASNLACGLGQIVIQTEQPTYENDYTGSYEDVGFPAALSLHVPVFHLGEVLIMDDDTGREIPYPGRKPSKWSVTCEEFDDVEAAVARAREVMDA